MKRSKVLVMCMVLVFVFAMFTGCAKTSTEIQEAKESTEASEAKAPEEVEESKDVVEETTEEGTRVIRFVLPRSIEVLDDAHVWVAKELGYFEEEGLEVVLEQSYGTTDIKMVSQHKGEFCVPSPAVGLTGVAGGVPIISVFQQDAVNIFGLCVLANSDIDSFDDLNGKKISVYSSSSPATIKPILIEGGADIDTIEFVVAGPQRAQLLSEGKVDAAYTWEKEWQVWVAQGMDFRFLEGEEVLKNCANSIVTSEEIYNNDPDLIKSFLRAYAKGLYFTKCNPQAATEIVLSKFPAIELTPDQALASIQALVKITNCEDTETYGYGYHNVDKWNLNIKWGKEMEILAADFDLDPTEYYTNEFIEYANDFDHAAVEDDAKNFVLAE